MIAIAPRLTIRRKRDHLDAAAVDVAAADGDVGPVVERRDELGELLGWMLEVGIDDRTALVAGFVEAPGDGGCEPRFLGAAHDTDRLGVRVGVGDELPGLVRRVIVDDDDLEAVVGEGVPAALDDALDVLALVVRRDDD